MIAVGVGVTDLQVGDLVAYAGPPPLGSYAEEQILPANKLVSVPPKLDPNYWGIHHVQGHDNSLFASILFQGWCFYIV